ncbi:DNA-binding transcriptional LysR family regulator [Clostridium saccharoperbutylacetonicum]|uniref:Transcriptional regulator, LysR family n=1 Tax=Clostridium saccharoperbutylacetonicum N1-4(HMT) TaxID=931276 RepID=M1N242_9CLOT|nr:LysR family transcriptional regulator [Clostridium saccharoperbutylacetonicum]AGF57552.1 transcriptional regulator, LysR family [Clostridium saccharoperbutylacetonicum N1-4(HMT)]NRT61680.1 DNA-binding transcriptional LysR family regulator [Clostridium saccharoperbutylacetonicum]NSB25003.1 DNA-binding transcriptional LysR family regulator [Clostridium saccharoperbutylacetonicum]NSB44374.1 DNA-binding transcriptional LysR family regulator [Clostridium saccharoperbutylacetonicum]
MEINDLRIFQTVAYEKSISKAALKLGYAQSNITMRIKLLENNLNTTLFIRNNKGTIITSNGEKLLKYADKILELIDEVNEEFIPTKIISNIKIGATQTISASILPKIFSLFYEKNPEVPLTLKTETQKVLVNFIQKAELDGAFISGEISSSKIKKIFTFKEKLALVSSVPITDVNHLTSPIIINSDKICPYRKLLQKWLLYNNSKPAHIIEFDSLESILRGIADGLGISLLPKSILPNNNKFFIYDLKNEFSELEVKFIANKNLQINPLLKDFINLVNSYISNSY